MPPFSNQSALPLPRGWRKVTRAGVLHAISVAAMAMTTNVRRAQASRLAMATDRLEDPGAALRWVIYGRQASAR